MRTRVVTLCLVVALVGCETPPTYSSSRKEQMTVLHPGDAVVSALGTPFYLAFKSVTCVLSAAIAAPVAGIAALSDSHFAPEIRRGLGDGINENCGPPYGAQPLSRAPGRANCRGARDDGAGEGARSIVQHSRCSSAAAIA